MYTIPNATKLPPNVLLSRVGHGDFYVPQTQRLQEQYVAQGRHSLKAKDWSLWGIRNTDRLVRLDSPSRCCRSGASPNWIELLLTVCAKAKKNAARLGGLFISRGHPRLDVERAK